MRYAARTVKQSMSPAQLSTARTNHLNLLALADGTLLLVETGTDNLRCLGLRRRVRCHAVDSSAAGAIQLSG